MPYTILDTPHLDAEFRIFGGGAFTDLVDAGITTALASWTAPDTGLPVGYVELTSRTSWSGNFATILQGNTVAWQATLRGENYDSTYLALGLTVVMWRRYWILGVGWQSWQRIFVGQFVSADDADDYRQGQRWRRTVEGNDYSIRRKNAARMTLGPINVMEGATVDIKNDDVLPDVSLELDKTEFYGGLESVDPDNLVDGKLNTVFISNSTPSVTKETPPIQWVDGVADVTEVFWAPATGDSVNVAWWVEILNTNDHITAVPGPVYFGHSPVAGGGGHNYTIVTLTLPSSCALPPGKFGIICANRNVFERITGGAPDAQWIYDAGEQANVTITMSQTDGFVSMESRCQQTVIWAPAGATRKINASGGTQKGAWYGSGPTYAAQNTFNSSSISTTSGYSIRRNLATIVEPYELEPGNPAWFVATQYPSPGSHSSIHDGVAIKVTLQECSYHLQNSVSAGATSVVLTEGTAGLFSSGDIYVQGGDTFHYTGTTATTLTGVTGILAHAADTQVWPYGAMNFGGSVTSAKQTGYPIGKFGWRRRKEPVPVDWLLYTSPLEDPLHFQETSFANDWYGGPIHVGKESANTRSWDCAIGNNNLPYAWVRCFLLVGNEMSDGGRFKLNEILAWMHKAQVGDAGDHWSVELDQPTSEIVARYLLVDYFGLDTADFDGSGSADTAHQIGSIATAVQPLSTVLDDLARQTGCLYYPSPSGKVYWLDDPRWPLVSKPDNWLWTDPYLLTADDLRGELQWSDSRSEVDWIILNASIVGGDAPVPIRIVYPTPETGTEPATGTQGEEISDIAVASEHDARLVAENLFYERQFQGTASCTLTAATERVAGSMIHLTYDFGGTGATTRNYIIERCEEVRSGSGRARKLDYRLTLRRFRD